MDSDDDRSLDPDVPVPLQPASTTDVVRAVAAERRARLEGDIAWV
jgi:hypothetical protein